MTLQPQEQHIKKIQCGINRLGDITKENNARNGNKVDFILMQIFWKWNMSQYLNLSAQSINLTHRGLVTPYGDTDRGHISLM